MTTRVTSNRVPRSAQQPEDIEIESPCPEARARMEELVRLATVRCRTSIEPFENAFLVARQKRRGGDQSLADFIEAVSAYEDAKSTAYKVYDTELKAAFTEYLFILGIVTLQRFIEEAERYKNVLNHVRDVNRSAVEMACVKLDGAVLEAGSLVDDSMARDLSVLMRRFQDEITDVQQTFDTRLTFVSGLLNRACKSNVPSTQEQLSTALSAAELWAEEELYAQNEIDSAVRAIIDAYATILTHCKVNSVSPAIEEWVCAQQRAQAACDKAIRELGLSCRATMRTYNQEVALCRILPL